MVRTRIAPSPTGAPHIGTIYQALFDWAYAKGRRGAFVVRIEDTDRKRFVEGAEEELYKTLDWLDLTEDESPRKGGKSGPYKQSERLDLYKRYAMELVKKGNAYYCFCTQERLKNVREEMCKRKLPPMYDKHCRNLSKEEVEKKLREGTPYVIRLKVPRDKTIIIKDEIRGDIFFETNTIDDQVILKSDGYPTYHLAVVVDDYLMGITHVIRGEEWISSYPKHKLIYEFLGWKMPKMYHTPLLRNPDKSKLSKRHSHTSMSWYKNQGFLPDAIVNFLALLGWSRKSGEEIFSKDTFVKEFDVKEIKAIGPIFDITKLEWMNGEYIRKLSDKDLSDILIDFLPNSYNEDIVRKTTPLIKERIKKLSDYPALCDFFFTPPKSYENSLTGRDGIIEKMMAKLEKIHKWEAKYIGEAMVTLANKEGISNSKFFMILRIAISGRKITPPLNESMEILGKSECIKRLGNV